MTDEVLDLRVYWRILIRRWWVVVATVAIAILVSTFVAQSAVPNYQSTARILVQSGQSPGIPSLGELQASQQLAESYRGLVTTRPVLEAVILELGLPDTVTELRSKIASSNSRSVISISATDLNADRAAAVANVVAASFIQDFRDRQLGQIAQFQESLERFGASENAEIVAAQAAVWNALTVVEEAVPPASPNAPSLLRYVLVAAIIALLLSGVIIVMLEYLDDTVRSPNELSLLTGIESVGMVPKFKLDGDRDSSGANARVPMNASEAYGFIRTHVDLSTSTNTPTRTILVASAAPSEGKTTTVAQLAAQFAKDDKSVVVVDSDLRRPQLHRIFGLSDTPGLSDVLCGDANLDTALDSTSDPGIAVLTSGKPQFESGIATRIEQFGDVLDDIKKRADIVIMDSPPLLAVSDALNLCSLADGVLLVVDAHKTDRAAIARAAGMVHQTGTPLLGVVLNKVKQRSFANAYYYPRKNYLDSDSSKGGLRSRVRLSGLFRIMGGLFR